MTYKVEKNTQAEIHHATIPFGINFEEYISDDEVNLMATNTRSMSDDDTGTTGRGTEDNDT